MIYPPLFLSSLFMCMEAPCSLPIFCRKHFHNQPSSTSIQNKISFEVQKEQLSIWSDHIYRTFTQFPTTADQQLALIWTTSSDHLFLILFHQSTVVEIYFWTSLHWILITLFPYSAVLYQCLRGSTSRFPENGCAYNESTRNSAFFLVLSVVYSKLLVANSEFIHISF